MWNIQVLQFSNIYTGKLLTKFGKVYLTLPNQTNICNPDIKMSQFDAYYLPVQQKSWAC